MLAARGSTGVFYRLFASMFRGSAVTPETIVNTVPVTGLSYTVLVRANRSDLRQDGTISGQIEIRSRRDDLDRRDAGKVSRGKRNRFFPQSREIYDTVSTIFAELDRSFLGRNRSRSKLFLDFRSKARIDGRATANTGATVPNHRRNKHR